MATAPDWFHRPLAPEDVETAGVNIGEHQPVKEHGVWVCGSALHLITPPDWPCPVANWSWLVLIEADAGRVAGYQRKQAVA